MFDKGIEQHLQYAFTEGVPMAVLTDGRQWSVYLPREPGSYAERRVDLLDVVKREAMGFMANEVDLGIDAIRTGGAVVAGFLKMVDEKGGELDGRL